MLHVVFEKQAKTNDVEQKTSLNLAFFGKRVIFECFPTISQSVFQIFQKVPNSNGFQVPGQFLLKKLKKKIFYSNVGFFLNFSSDCIL